MGHWISGLLWKTSQQIRKRRCFFLQWTGSFMGQTRNSVKCLNCSQDSGPDAFVCSVTENKHTGWHTCTCLTSLVERSPTNNISTTNEAQNWSLTFRLSDSIIKDLKYSSTTINRIWCVLEWTTCNRSHNAMRQPHQVDSIFWYGLS